MGSRSYAFAILTMALYGWCSGPLSAQVNVVTYHNDNARSGQNTQETILTPANVNSSHFGKLFSVVLDGMVFAQPLYVSNVNIGGGVHNVVYVATEHDSLYAIDADSGAIFWRAGLLPQNATTLNNNDFGGCDDLSPEVGITGTPAIDIGTGTIYLVTKAKLSGNAVQLLHALDIATAAEKFGGPVSIQAVAPGSASDGNGSTINFNPLNENQRPALLLENGHLVIGWAAHCDNAPWHGWIIAYSAGTLSQEAVFNASPNGYGNGIWMSGGGLAADSNGNIFFSTGNGSWNGTTDFGDSIVKLGPPSGGVFPVLDFFTPYNQGILSEHDSDVASGGVVLLPTLSSGQQLLAQMGKEGKIYLIDRNNMGQYCVNQMPACTNNDPQIVQEIAGATAGVWGSPAYWNGSIYWGPASDDTVVDDRLKAFSFNAGNSGLVSTTATSQSAKTFSYSSPIPSISANGSVSGILWGLDNSAFQSTCNGGSNCQVLYAYDATNLASMLYNSSQAANLRDVPGGAVKFATPTVANGKVYVGGQFVLSAYGLLAMSPTAATPTLSPGPGNYTLAQTVMLSDSTPGAVIYYTTDGSMPTTLSTKYGAALHIGATTMLQAIAVANGYINSAASGGSYVIAPAAGAPVIVSLSSVANVYALFDDGSPVTHGGLDGSGDAYSASLAGTSLTWSGSTFTLGGAAALSAASGTSIPLPAGRYSNVDVLATAVNGNQINQTFVVTYSDGTTKSIQQNLSDWYTPQGYAGESVALKMPYRLTATGAPQNKPFNLYAYSFALDSSKTVQSIKLPNNRNAVVLAVTLLPSSVPTNTGPVSATLGTASNVDALANDGSNAINGGLDGAGDSYSATLAGSSITWSGNTFALGRAGTLDAASGTTLSLPAGNFSTLNLLATGVHGNQAGQSFVVTYSDGSTTTFQQSLSDWYTPQKFAGESTAVSMAYRLTPNAGKQNGPFNLYGYSFTLTSTKTVKSLRLPNNRNVIVLSATLDP